MGYSCENKKQSKHVDALVRYNISDKKFQYISGLEQFEAIFDTRPFWHILKESHIIDSETANTLQKIIEHVAALSEAKIYNEEMLFNLAGEEHVFRVGIICAEPGREILITLSDKGYRRILPEDANWDSLTGLMTQESFCDMVDKVLQSNSQKTIAGGYAVIYFDIIRFMAINEMFGTKKGDLLLRYIADTIRRFITEGEFACRIDADRFAVFVENKNNAPERFLDFLRDSLSKYAIVFEVTFNAGICVTSAEENTCNKLTDRAILAQESIKGNYSKTFGYFTDSLYNMMMGEHEIVGQMAVALTQKQFVIYFQPQYDHSTGMLVGTEALVRWMHPERNIISPALFIPIFEKNGFITKLDFYVFEETCSFLKKNIDAGLHIVPISVNFSRYDIFQANFVDTLESIRKKYDVPVKYLRVELTESATVGGAEHLNEVIHKLHDCGYIVEMDDFGSGYSSLNVLKEIDFDVIKLDMRFMEDHSKSKKGGTILSSVVRMAKWLSLPVIAEGVESVGQADFLKSIGCNYIQGYLYSKPVPKEDYLKLISGKSVGMTLPQMKLIDTIKAHDFWDPTSLETLIFSNYVGGAAIFDYSGGKAEILRVNLKYLQEIGMNLSEKEVIDSNPFSFLDAENEKIYRDMLDRAIASGEEEECETWRTICSSCCGTERFCIRANVRMIGKSEDHYLFYAMLRNITIEKQVREQMLDTERRFKVVSEQVKIYFWEYTIATREMRPCFRCMRDLGLPPVVTNYPEPVIEQGIFPADYADMYRDWHKQVEQGVESLEAIIPLTPDRIPFRVRYTTGFDETGRPIKAYGSAALIVE